MMRSMKITLTALFLALSWGGASTARAEVQLGDLLKKVAGKDSAKAKKSDKTETAGAEQGKANAEEKDSTQGATRTESAEGVKVDRFIDRNNDGIDDRRQSKVKRDERRTAPAAAPNRPRRETPAAPADSGRGRPPG
jgi:hypothetical protein